MITVSNRVGLTDAMHTKDEGMVDDGVNVDEETTPVKNIIFRGMDHPKTTKGKNDSSHGEKLTMKVRSTTNRVQE